MQFCIGVQVEQRFWFGIFKRYLLYDVLCHGVWVLYLNVGRFCYGSINFLGALYKKRVGVVKPDNSKFRVMGEEGKVSAPLL
jgi:hypothetical protein